MAQITRRLITRLAAAAVLLGIVLVAAAYSSQDSFSEADLLKELRKRDIQFELQKTYTRSDGTFGSMNGFVVTRHYIHLGWSHDPFWVTQFAGPGEAIAAASRVSPDGYTFDYPVKGSSSWITAGAYPAFPVQMYQRGSLIVTYAGKRLDIPDALEEIMGKPFAGDRAYGDRMRLGDDFPLFKDLWREYPVKVDSVQVEKLHSRPDDLAYRVNFEAFTVHSYACSGPTSDLDREVVGDEIHFTYVQRLVNLDEVELTEPCDLDWQWEEGSLVAQGLTAGQEYKVFINDEQVATFTAEG